MQVLDAGFQVMASIDTSETYLPVRVESIELHGKTGADVWCHAELVSNRGNRIIGDLRLYDDSGRLLAEVKHLHCKRVESQRETSRETLKNNLYEYEWMLDDRSHQKASRTNIDYFQTTGSFQITNY